MGRFWCDNPWEERRKGREAARFGENYTSEHQDRMRNRHDDECDNDYARAYDREIEQKRYEAEEERRREEEAQRHAREQVAQELADQERRWEEETAYREQEDE